ncbi:MAG: type II secretion system protein [Limisphaerales bacterium]
MKKKSAFTLPELLVVMMVIAILAALLFAAILSLTWDCLWAESRQTCGQAELFRSIFKFLSLENRQPLLMVD